MKWDVVLERNPETAVWVAEVVGVPGCYTQGATRTEALQDLREAFELVRATDGLPARPQVEFTSIEA